MSTVMTLIHALYEEQEWAMRSEDYAAVHGYDLAVDLADSLSKGVSANVWLPRYREALLETVSKVAPDEATALHTALVYVDTLIAEM